MRSSTGGTSRGARVPSQPVLVVALLGVLLVVSLIASGRWGRCALRRGCHLRRRVAR
jgi:hypothetical protein